MRRPIRGPRCLCPDPRLRVPMQALEDAKNRSAFIGRIFCRYSDYLLAQVMQSAACNAYHSIPERAARWLLHAQDRAGDRIELTQEAFAGLLGVQRTTVNAVIRELASQALIATGRGNIRVIDRDGLKQRSCECYQRLQDHFDAVIGTSGSGAPSPATSIVSVSPAWNGTRPSISAGMSTFARSNVTCSSFTGSP